MARMLLSISLSVVLVAANAQHVRRNTEPSAPRRLQEESKAKHWACGVGNPDSDEPDDGPPLRAPQRYASRKDARRRLVTQQEEYDKDDDDSFLHIDDAEAANLTANIRIALVWEPIDEGEDEHMCNEEGETITLQGGDAYECESDDIALPGTDRYDVMKDRTEWAKEWWQKTLRLKPVQDTLRISGTVANDYNLEQQDYPDTDLIIIMVARPAAQNIAGSATCLQEDQHGRCTVGRFRWVPAYLSPEERGSPDVIEDERHTAAHEINHVLGGILTTTKFLDEDGNARDDDEIFEVTDGLPEDGDVEKPLTFIKTERVQAIAREHFACDDLLGVPLEDLELGRGSHWESRVMGAEFMSYGTGSGEAYISDLTIAFMEDTNHYRADYSFAGRFVVPETQDVNVRTSGFFVDESRGKFEPAPPRNPGALTFGRGEGCSFVLGNPRNWNPRYLCNKHQEFGCTFDNRMSAICSLRTGLSVDRHYSCGLPRSQDSSCEEGPENPTCDEGDCQLPPEMQYFSDSQARAAFEGHSVPEGVEPNSKNTAGWSRSMDYVPVMAGYWHCQDSRASTNVSGRAGEESGFSLPGILGAAEEEMELFGGQSRCPKCRCFPSSLREFTFGFDPRFPRFGLCYRANCYRPDYLQIGIQNQVGNTVSWYKCPSGGGRIYIAGFTGSVSCPPAEEFCAFEDASGVRYPETDFLMEIVVYGVIGGLLLVTLLVCCIPSCRDKLVMCCKRKCGALDFESTFVDEQGKVLPEVRDPPRRAGWVLLIVNIIGLLPGLGLLGASIYAIATDELLSAAVPAGVVGLLTTLVAIMGIYGSKKAAHGASGHVLLYFYALLLVTLMFSFMGIYVLASDGVIDDFVDRQWEVVREVIPSSAYDEDAPRDEQVEDGQKYVEDRAPIIGAVFLVIMALFITGLISSGMVIGPKALTSTTLGMLSHSFTFVGFLMIGIGGLFIHRNDGGFASVGGVGVVAGAVALSLGILGTCGAKRRSRKLLRVHALMTLLLTILLVVAGIVALVRRSSITEDIEDMDDEELAELQDTFGIGEGRDRDEIKEEIENQMTQVAIAAFLGAVVSIMLLTSVLFYLKYMRRQVSTPTGHLGPRPPPEEHMPQPPVQVSPTQAAPHPQYFEQYMHASSRGAPQRRVPGHQHMMQTNPQMVRRGYA